MLELVRNLKKAKAVTAMVKNLKDFMAIMNTRRKHQILKKAEAVTEILMEAFSQR